MTQEETMMIATRVFPDSLTWDILTKITDDPELLETILTDAAKHPLFSDEQEKEIKGWVSAAISGEILNFNHAYLRLVNWTDIIYALVKAYEPRFNPDNHV